MGQFDFSVFMCSLSVFCRMTVPWPTLMPFLLLACLREMVSFLLGSAIARKHHTDGVDCRQTESGVPWPVCECVCIE